VGTAVYGNHLAAVGITCYMLWYGMVGGKGNVFWVFRVADRLCDMVLHYLMEGFEWNLPQIFITWVGKSEKVFKVRERSRSLEVHS